MSSLAITSTSISPGAEISFVLNFMSNNSGEFVSILPAIATQVELPSNIKIIDIVLITLFLIICTPVPFYIKLFFTHKFIVLTFKIKYSTFLHPIYFIHFIICQTRIYFFLYVTECLTHLIVKSLYDSFFKVYNTELV